MLRKNWLPHAENVPIILVAPTEDIPTLKKMSSDWKVIHDKGYRGAGGPRTVGLAHVMKTRGEYDAIFVGDDDAKSKLGDLDRVATTIIQKNIIVGPKWNFDRKNIGLIERDNLGVLWGFPEYLPHEIGNFDKDFIAFEDREFQLRARWAGVSPFSDTSWVIQHTRHQPGGLDESLYGLEITYALFEKKYPGLMKPVYNKDGTMRAMRRDKNYVPK